jgi:YHS domain-containing protein
MATAASARVARGLQPVGVPLSAAAHHAAGCMPVDPVCGTAVDPAHSAGVLRHDGVEYHFCSLGCAWRFAPDPDRFTRRSSEESPDAGRQAPGTRHAPGDGRLKTGA